MIELKTEDFVDFDKAEKAIFELMKDGKWHSATEIIDHSGQREGLRRMRTLREKPIVKEIIKKRTDKREWIYKMELFPEFV